MARLQKLVLRNFKSFRKADIPISKGFTAIVGSNGSGKTNILDGLLFVLGISSMKMLRVSKLEELVNNNALENYAKVELALKEGDRQYILQRMIDKQGKSVYRLDGKRKTKNEIVSLLLELGIKSEGHNIVVQGDTTRVIEMSPLERRQIIDELAGLQEFDAKKEEALKELQKVDNKIRDAGIVMQERENYLEKLRADKEAAAKFSSLEKEGKSIKATILFTEMERIEKAEKESGEKLEEIKSEKAVLEEKISKGLSEKSGLRTRAEKLNKDILAQSEKTYATVGSQLEEARTQKALLGERLENKASVVERNRQKKQALGEKAEHLRDEILAQETRASEIGHILLELGKKIRGANERKGGLEASAGKREEKLAEMNAEREKVFLELDKCNEELFEKQTALNSLLKESEMRRQAMRETIQENEALDARLSEREKKAGLLAGLEKKFGNISAALSKAERESEKALDSLKESEAEKRNIAESIEMLGKSFASCPVCEAELAKEKKKALALKKEARMKELLDREQGLRLKRKDILARISELKEAGEKATKLAIECSDSQELREKLKAGRERLSGLKQWLTENAFDEIKNEVASLEEKAEAKRASLAAQSEKVRAFQASIALEELQSASNALAKLEKEEHSLRQEKKGLLESAEKHIQTQINAALEEAGLLKEENQKLSKEISLDEKRLAGLDSEVSSLEAKVNESERKAKKMVEEKDGIDRLSEKLEQNVSAKRLALKSLVQKENELLIGKSKREVRLIDLKQEASEFEGIERIKEFEAGSLNARAKEIEKKVAELGAINMKALDSFNQLETEVLDVRKKVEKLDEERLAVVEMIEKIDVKRTNVFMDCFKELSKNFARMFNTLFSGEGQLALSKPETPLEAGLLIQAKHKGNSIKNIDSMSGGEKTMTALAFLFAIQLYEPASFYIFDEADAALDKENSIKMAKIIKKISSQSQFIAITHNDPLVQEADQIIGVALNKEKSSVIGLKLREKMAEENP